MELRCGLNISQEIFLHRKSLLRLHACQGVIIHSVEEQKAGGCVCAALGLGPRSASAAAWSRLAGPIYLSPAPERGKIGCHFGTRSVLTQGHLCPRSLDSAPI